MSIKCGHCQERHESVRDVRQCAMRNGVSAGKIAETNGLLSERGCAYCSDGTCSRCQPIVRRPTNTAERAEESRQAAQVKTKQRATEGMYRKAGTIYKVQKAVHDNGKTYAKRLVELVGHQDPKTGKSKWRFEYAPGFVFELRPEHRLSIEQAKEFGALYGTCCVCGRTLTKESSIADGIGPICAEKF